MLNEQHELWLAEQLAHQKPIMYSGGHCNTCGSAFQTIRSHDSESHLHCLFCNACHGEFYPSMLRNSKVISQDTVIELILNHIHQKTNCNAKMKFIPQTSFEQIMAKSTLTPDTHWVFIPEANPMETEP